MSGDTEKFWQDIGIRIYPDPFFASCKISTINKNSGSNSYVNPNTSFKWVSIEIIAATPFKSPTKYTTFSNYLLIVDDYSNIPKLY